MESNELTRKIIQAAMKVHTAFCEPPPTFVPPVVNPE